MYRMSRELIARKYSLASIFCTWLAVLELRLSLPPPQLLLAAVALGVSATTSAGGGGRSRPLRSRKTLSASEEASEGASSLPGTAAALLSCELIRLEDRGLLDLWYDAWLDTIWVGLGVTRLPYFDTSTEIQS